MGAMATQSPAAGRVIEMKDKKMNFDSTLIRLEMA